MFISKDDIKTHLFDYQIDQITGGDDTIVSEAVSAATEEVKAYLAARYDTAAIFAATGADRSALVLSLVKTVAVYRLLLLCNVDAIYERYETAYDKASQFLRQLAAGDLVADLPYKDTASGNPAGTIQITSNTKFTHNF